MKYKAVGFDLGETLYTYKDTPLSWSEHYAPALQGAYIDVIQDLAHSFASPSGILTKYNTRVHPRTFEVCAEEIFTEVSATFGLTDEDVGDRVDAFFQYFRTRLMAYPETLQTLRQLVERGSRLGALTDVPYGMPSRILERDLHDTGVHPFLRVVLSSVEVGWRKPDRRGFEKLAEVLGVPVESLLFVGNEEKDVRGAKDAGCSAVLICRDGYPRNWGQDHTISDLTELLGLV